MSSSASPKGKQGTKGRKQIVEENKATLQFYIYIMCAATCTHVVVSCVFFWSTLTFTSWFFLFFSLSVFAASYKFLSMMAKAAYSDDGALLDGGIDLNMESGMSEHAKDLILLTAIVQILSVFSLYVWWLWLSAPLRAVYLIWFNILSPWFFSEAPEVNEKKQKKMDRKLRRR